jgi:hypothetical protein
MPSRSAPKSPKKTAAVRSLEQERHHEVEEEELEEGLEDTFPASEPAKPGKAKTVPEMKPRKK